MNRHLTPEESLNQPCPTCEAEPGTPCFSRETYIDTSPHVRRRTLPVVKLEVSFVVDVAAWCREYGVSQAEVPDDVRNYMTQIMQHAEPYPVTSGIVSVVAQ